MMGWYIITCHGKVFDSPARLQKRAGGGVKPATARLFDNSLSNTFGLTLFVFLARIPAV